MRSGASRDREGAGELLTLGRELLTWHALQLVLRLATTPWWLFALLPILRSSRSRESRPTRDDPR